MLVRRIAFKDRSGCLLLGLVLLLLFGFVRAEQSVRVTDALGRQVTLQKPLKRIVTIFSSNTEMVAALGLSEQIVGIDAFTYYPESVKNKPKIGGRLGFSLDSIVAQQPDLVVMTPARQATHQLLPPLDTLGIPTLVLEARNIDEVIHNIDLLAKATGTQQKGNALISQMRQRLNKASHKPAGYHRPKVILITGKVGNGLLLVARTNTTRTNGYTADIVIKAGGILALDEMVQSGPRLSQISPEVLLASNSDIVLFAGSQQDLAELTSLPGWQQMKAAKTGFVRTVPRAQLLIPGPRVVDGVEQLALIFNEWSQKQ